MQNTIIVEPFGTFKVQCTYSHLISDQNIKKIRFWKGCLWCAFQNLRLFMCDKSVNISNENIPKRLQYEGHSEIFEWRKIDRGIKRMQLFSEYVDDTKT